MRSWLPYLVVSTIGCAGATPRPVTPGEIRVGRIEIEGARSVDDDELIRGLGLAYARDNGRPFERYLVAMDRRRIRGFYARRGFFDVSVQNEVDRVRGAANVTFTITEGVRARLARVEILGLPAGSTITTSELRAIIPLEDGGIYDHETFELALPTLVTALENAGYAHARVHDSVYADRERDLAVIRLAIDTGPFTRFGVITVTGVDGDLADAVRGRLRVREGAPFSPSAIDDSRVALYEMGRFASVRIESDRGSRDPVVPVAIEVVLAKRHELRLGAGVGVNPAFYEVRGRSRYAVAGWPTALTSTSVELRPAIVRLRDAPEYDPRLEAFATIERLDLFRPRMRGEAEAGFDYLSIEAYTSVGPRLRLGLATPLYKRRVHIAAGWRLSMLEFLDLHPALDESLIEALGLRGTYVLGYYEQRLMVDLRDDPVAPRLGAYAELGVAEGTRAAGGELTFLRVVLELRGYVPIGPFVAAGRTRFGVIAGEIPVTQRFFGGGASSQRGFPERRLSPFASRATDDGIETVPYGGAAVLELGAELRVPLGTIRGFEVGGVTFLDGADVRERAGDLDALDVHWAAGAGLRIATPVGPFRADVGYRLNRFSDGEPLPGDRLAFHISIGEAF